VPTDADDGYVLCARRNGDARAGGFVDTARVFGGRDLPFHDDEISGKAEFAQRSFDRPAVSREIAGGPVAEGGGREAHGAVLVVRRRGRERGCQDRRGQRACEHRRLHFDQDEHDLASSSCDGPRSKPRAVIFGSPSG
jgi:hypothetical protein